MIDLTEEAEELRKYLLKEDINIEDINLFDSDKFPEPYKGQITEEEIDFIFGD